MDWLQKIRDLHDQHFAFDWYAHTIALNQRYGLRGDDAFTVNAPGLPPQWFNGDVEAIEPARWVLVESLNYNYSRAESDRQWWSQQRFDSASWWDYMRRQNRTWWYPQFYGPLVRVAARALGEEVHADQESEFATTRMVFLEFCPYQSHRFWLPWETVDEMNRTDIGFHIAATLRKALIEEGLPALVLVNGKAAMRNFERIHEKELIWVEHRYPSVDRPSKTLWHKSGTYSTSSGESVPIAGFPFLRKPGTHNSHAELKQLSALIGLPGGNDPR